MRQYLFRIIIQFTALSVVSIMLLNSCSNKKNTATTRAYHSINTRYNIHFNADIAYQEALQQKIAEQEDNLSQMLYIYPEHADSISDQGDGSFTTTIDKTTKAIKLHSISVKPRRDKGKMKDPNYKAWVEQKEFNPFLKNTWLLLAKSEFEEGAYLKSISTFMYITKMYSKQKGIVDECRLWITRAYAEMGWRYEAEDMLRKIDQAGGVSADLQGLYSSVKANYLIHIAQYQEALPYLLTAIEKEKSKMQKTRLKYLLGQVYAKVGDNRSAVEAFKSVQGMSIPYKYSLNAQISELELSDIPLREAVSRFNKMASRSRNKEYLDKIYFTIGERFIQVKDTANAIKYYGKSIQQEEVDGYDKAMARVRLGGIYFAQKDFVKAQPCYSVALGKLDKKHADYAQVYHRSSVLDELVVHIGVVHEQDSLQHLASLPEAERMRIILAKIEEVKEVDKKEERERKREEQLTLAESASPSWSDMDRGDYNPPISQMSSALSSSQASFYFYNPQTVTQGRAAFQRKWGRRKLEDDWRRRDKSVSLFDGMSDELENDDSIEGIERGASDNDSASSDETELYSPEFYIEQIPLNEEDIKASNDLIDNALFSMGGIYKEKLEDLRLAIDAYTNNINRFPNGDNLEVIYYQLFLIYMQLEERPRMLIYRNKLMNEFPQGEYARPLTDSNFEWNFKHMATEQNKLYETTYNAYLAGDITEVRRSYEEVASKFPIGDIVSKFAFLNALTYAQTREVEQLDKHLRELIAKYPKSDITPLATKILERIVDGQMLMSDGTPIRSFDWSSAYKPRNVQEEGALKELNYIDNPSANFMLLLSFKAGSVDKNELLYQVADYNFSNYVVQVHDLSYESDGIVEILQIKGFKGFSEIRNYINKAFEEDGLFHHLDFGVSVLPISTDNYKIIPQLGEKAYKDFFEKQYIKQLSILINYWKTNKISFYEESDEENAQVGNVVPLEKVSPVEGVVEKVEKIIIRPSDVKKVQPTSSTKNEKEVELTPEQIEQRKAEEQADKILESVGGVINNPVDGIKTLFESTDKKEKLTKEEKEALKAQERIEKERRKEIEVKDRQQADSLRMLEKALEDSIMQEERVRIEQQREQREAKQNEVRIKEQKQKGRVREQEELRKQKENERRELLKSKEKQRREKVKQQEELRRQREREREGMLKAREEQRKIKQKEASNK